VPWVQQHSELLTVIGVVLAGIGVVIAWLQLRKKEPPAASTVDRSETNSAVASGVGNTPIAIHSEGDVIFNHPPPSVPVQPKLGKPEPRRPNIKYIGASTVSIEDAGRVGLVERGGSGPNAIVIRFRNEAEGTQTVGVCVRALLIYKDGEHEIDSVKGFWLETQSNIFHCHVDDRLTVLAGLVVDGTFIAYEAQKHVLSRDIYHVPDPHYLRDFTTSTLFVRLTDADHGHVLYTGEFVVTKNPLSIVPKKVA